MDYIENHEKWMKHENKEPENKIMIEKGNEVEFGMAQMKDLDLT